MAKIHENQYVGIVFQVIVFILSALALFVIFYPRYIRFDSYDQPPHFRHWSAEELAQKEAVTVGLYIRTFAEFNIAKNNFVTDATVWFEFDEKKISLEDIKKFSVVDGQLLSVSEPLVSKQNGSTFVRFNTKIQFKTKLDYRMFPLDDHWIRIIITNPYLPKNVILVSTKEDFSLGNEFSLPGWKVVEKVVRSGYAVVPYAQRVGYSLDHVRAAFSLSCKRTDPIMITSMLMTFMVIILLVLSLFSTDIGGLDVLSSGILALISYLFVLESQSPPHIGYFMLTDLLFTLCLIVVILCMLASLYAHHYDVKTTVKKGIIISAYLLFVGGCLFANMIL